MMTGGFIGLGAILWKPLPLYMSGRLYTMIVVAGVVIYFSGVGIYLWGFFTIRSFFCVSNIAGAELYANHQLITHGPYACVRHPMYLGVFLAAIGGLLIFQTWAMMIFTPMSFVVIKRAEHEEKLLESEFGEKWRQYSLKTPMWLPRIW